ncbi:hypothetical protein O181_072096 [Austropuccinia psidii MF-1]|uniref:Uncharacterized protein n=1 Tax=Austropuccinia psidii MF-1 TaxID=1389203 RepID=A0A9Q3F1Z8_9BASI|nr:hypothetical protein [Austropuccinia psidii MF-1]
MESASPSKISHNPDESKEEIINEETMQGQEDISEVARLHQIMLEIQQEIIELLKKKGKGKSPVLLQKTAQWKKLQECQEGLDKKGQHHHFQGPWLHQLHSLHRDQILYQSR